MTRTDYFNDPSAPEANSIVPAVTAFVVNEQGGVLLERRSDNGRWGMPGGVQEVGESITDTVVREVREETGLKVTVSGLVGIYTDPGHIIEFSDGEIRQEFSLCFRAQVTGGDLRASAESFEVRWVPRSELPTLDISPTTRLRLADGLADRDRPHLG